MWVVKFSLQCEDFFGIIVLQSVGHLLSGSMMGLMVTSSKRTYTTWHASHVRCSQSPCPCSRPLLIHASAGDTQILKGMSGSIFVGPCVLVHTKFCLSPLTISVVGMGFDSKCNFLLPFYWGFSFALLHGVSFFLVGSNIPLSMVVQQRVAILEFSQEEMSACPSTPPCYAS